MQSKSTVPPGVRRRQWGILVIDCIGAICMAALTVSVAVKLVQIAPGSGPLVVLVVFLTLLAVAFGALVVAELRNLGQQR